MELAATALSAELTIVTKDAKDFGPTGVALGGEFDFSKAQTARLIPGTKADSLSRLSRQDYGGHRLPDHCDRGTVSRLLRLLSRFGMLVLCALQDAAWRSITLARKEVEYLLRSWRHFFAGVRPRGISVQEEMPVLLLTDRGVE